MKRILLFCLFLIVLVPVLSRADIVVLTADSTDSYTLTTKAKDTTVIFQEFIGDYYPTQVCPVIGMPTAGVDSILVVKYYWGYFGTDWNALVRTDTLVTAGTCDYINKNATAATVYPQKWIPIDSLGPWLRITAIITADNGGDTAASLKYHTAVMLHNAVPNHLTPKGWCMYDTGMITVSYGLAADAADTTTLFEFDVGNRGITKMSVATYLYSGLTNIDSLLRIIYDYSHCGEDNSWTLMAAADTLIAEGVDTNTYGYVTAGALDNFWIPYDTLAYKFRARAILEADHPTGGDTGTYTIKYCLLGIDERCDPPYRSWDYNFQRDYNISYELAAAAADTTDLFIVNMVAENLMAVSPEVFLTSLGGADSLIMVRYYRSADSLNWTALAAVDTILEKSVDTLRISRTAPTWLKADSTGVYFKGTCLVKAPGLVGDSSYFNVRATVKGISEVCKQF